MCRLASSQYTEEPRHTQTRQVGRAGQGDRAKRDPWSDSLGPWDQRASECLSRGQDCHRAPGQGCGLPPAWCSAVGPEEADRLLGLTHPSPSVPSSVPGPV